MSDYMFMLESHLSTGQNRVVSEVQAAAADANMSLFLTGGAMRDVLGGFAVRDLDFTVEGKALKLLNALGKRAGAKVLSQDDYRNTAELLFPGRVTASIGMARRETFPKPGVRPQVAPATIHEDLRCRDFTVNAIALSLNRASRGLLVDPTNGLADLERKELRAVHPYVLYDDPARLLRLIRLKVRLGFTIEERTLLQYRNVRETGLEDRIAARRLFEELECMAGDPNPADGIRAFEEEKLLRLYSKELAGPKLNIVGLAKLQRAKQHIPFGVPFPIENLGLFLFFLAERLNKREEAAFIKATAMHKSEVSLWQKLEPRAKKLEKAVKSPKLHKPSQVYQVLHPAAGDEILFLLVRSDHRLVQDRIRNYLEKYLPMAQEVTEEEVCALGAEPGTPKFRKVKEDLILAKLNARPKKVVVEEPVPPGPPQAETGLRKPIARRVQ